MVLRVGRGVSNFFKNNVRSCSIALGRPVVPVENKTSPACSFLLNSSIKLCERYGDA